MVAVVVVPSSGMSLEDQVSHLVMKKEGNTVLSDNSNVKNSINKPTASQQQCEQVNTNVNDIRKLITIATLKMSTSMTATLIPTIQLNHQQLNTNVNKSTKTSTSQQHYQEGIATMWLTTATSQPASPTSQHHRHHHHQQVNSYSIYHRINSDHC